jgi:ABC-2 type transport system ATP-binding protein
MGEVVAYLTRFGIRDLTSRPPTLEELFMRHYEGSAEGGREGGTEKGTEGGAQGGIGASGDRVEQAVPSR